MIVSELWKRAWNAAYYARATELAFRAARQQRALAQKILTAASIIGGSGLATLHLGDVLGGALTVAVAACLWIAGVLGALFLPGASASDLGRAESAMSILSSEITVLIDELRLCDTDAKAPAKLMLKYERAVFAMDTLRHVVPEVSRSIRDAAGADAKRALRAEQDAEAASVDTTPGGST